jgi:hypothetical protein
VGVYGIEALAAAAAMLGHRHADELSWRPRCAHLGKDGPEELMGEPYLGQRRVIRGL